MSIIYNGREYVFRGCDVVGISKDQLTQAVNRSCKVWYDYHNGNEYMTVKVNGQGIIGIYNY